MLTLEQINIKLKFINCDSSQLIRLLLRSIAIKTGCSGYNCMIAGAILGAVFGMTQIPEEFYDSMDTQLMHRINNEIWQIIAAM